MWLNCWKANACTKSKHPMEMHQPAPQGFNRWRSTDSVLAPDVTFWWVISAWQKQERKDPTRSSDIQTFAGEAQNFKKSSILGLRKRKFDYFLTKHSIRKTFSLPPKRRFPESKTTKWLIQAVQAGIASVRSIWFCCPWLVLPHRDGQGLVWACKET